MTAPERKKPKEEKDDYDDGNAYMRLSFFFFRLAGFFITSLISYFVLGIRIT